LCCAALPGLAALGITRLRYTMWLRFELRCLVLRALGVSPNRDSGLTANEWRAINNDEISWIYTVNKNRNTLDPGFVCRWIFRRSQTPSGLGSGAYLAISRVTGRQGRPGQLLLTASLSHTP
jgi:hypothetical protein